MLPTPPHSDAVTIDYRPENVCLERTLTSLTKRPHGRTTAGFQPAWATKSPVLVLPRGLLARAAFHRTHGTRHHAEVDLNEAEEIAERGGMRLFQADVHLERTALHLQYDENAEARERLDRAVELIEACGYGRRLRDVEYLEGVLAGR